MTPRSSSSPPATTMTQAAGKEDLNSNNMNNMTPAELLSRIHFRTVVPTDIGQCLIIERASYPPDEAASKNSLQYRQHHAAPFFRCAVLMPLEEEEEEATEGVEEEEEAADQPNMQQIDGMSSPSTISVEDNAENGGSEQQQQQQYQEQQNVEYFERSRRLSMDEQEGEIIGFICSTRCHEMTHESMSVHVHDGPLLAIHSVVVKEEYRRNGIATAMMKDYINNIRECNITTYSTCIQKLVLIAKQHLLSFYVDCGFSVSKPSSIVHGKERWYDLELDLTESSTKSGGRGGGALTNNGRDGSKGGNPCFMVDSFATSLSRPGTGNPAAVVLLSESTHYDEGMESWCQTIAAEFNLAETAFCWPRRKSKSVSSGSSGGGNNKIKKHGDQQKEVHWNIRYFTPKVEIPLCGHATLASAAILYSGEHNMTLNPQNTNIVFHAKEDVLVMEYATPSARSKDANAPNLSTSQPSLSGSSTNIMLSSSSSLTSLNSPANSPPTIPPVRISMEFPAKPATELTTRDELSAVNKMLESAFTPCKLDGILYIGRTDLGDVLVEVTPKNFHDIGYECLNYKALLEWDGYYRGVIICCRSPTDGQKRRPSTPLPTPLSRTSSGGSSVDMNGITAAATAQATDTRLPLNEPAENDRSTSLNFDATLGTTNERQEGTSPSSPSAATSANPSSASPDFLSRFFGPKAGIDEDPVTGSAHCVLGPYFAKKLKKNSLIGKQMSERGGIVECYVKEDKVILTGSALITMSGTIWV